MPTIDEWMRVIMIHAHMKSEDKNINPIDSFHSQFNSEKFDRAEQVLLRRLHICKLYVQVLYLSGYFRYSITLSHMNHN